MTVSLLPARIDGVALAVQDVERSAAFYREMMGFKQTSLSAELARFQLENLRLTLVRKEALLEEMHLSDLPTAPGPVTLAVSVSRTEVDELMRGLEDAGVLIIAPAEDKRLGPRIGFAADPDGHVWEIIADD